MTQKKFNKKKIKKKKKKKKKISFPRNGQKQNLKTTMKWLGN